MSNKPQYLFSLSKWEKLYNTQQPHAPVRESLASTIDCAGRFFLPRH